MWEQVVGCVDHYLVRLQPNKGKVIMHPEHDGSIQVHKQENTLYSLSSAWIFFCMPVNKTGNVPFSLDSVATS